MQGWRTSAKIFLLLFGMFFEEKFSFLLRLRLDVHFAQVLRSPLPLFFIKDLGGLGSSSKHLELLQQDNLDITYSTSITGVCLLFRQPQPV